MIFGEALEVKQGTPNLRASTATFLDILLVFFVFEAVSRYNNQGVETMHAPTLEHWALQLALETLGLFGSTIRFASISLFLDPYGLGCKLKHHIYS